MFNVLIGGILWLSLHQKGQSYEWDRGQIHKFAYRFRVQAYFRNRFEQGFAYPITDLPSPVATDNGELSEVILNFDQENYNQKADKFLSQMGFCDDENSCKRIVDFILDKMEHTK